MSLDVTLRKEVYTANITHNLGKMAESAGIYKALWRPEEEDYYYARDLIEPLTKGLALLTSDPERFKAFNSPNGWGMYEHFVPFVAQYLEACAANPDATVEASR
jgi:hypothetical protein